MSDNAQVVCLRPEQDFLDIGVTPPERLSITYLPPDAPELAESLRAAEALLIPAVGPKLDAALFDGSAVKLVQVTGAGVDRLDRPAMEKLGVAVANVVGGSNSALADYCVAAALNLLRRMSWASHEIRKGRYAQFRAEMVTAKLPGLDGMTVGLVGLGTIGRAVARAFKDRGSKIVYFDPQVDASTVPSELEATSLDLDALLAQSDVVTLHVPLIPQTENLIGAAQLALMKPDAVLINAARGGIVDEAALAASLTNAKLAGAAVDVFSTEPPDASNPLLALEGEAAERLLLTPHIAGVTRQSWAGLFEAAWANVVRVVADGEAPVNRVY
ncbi:MAG: hydroxyacid dehydrogenase [Gammaproteobacteria bacterium]|nr:hydroxyacid dehydrogenase [Gammaproteobacteria bacterium]